MSNTLVTEKVKKISGKKLPEAKPARHSAGTEITGAQAVMEALVAENVTDFFGYPGGAIMLIY